MKRWVIILVFSTRVIAVEPSESRQQALQNMLLHDCGSCHGLTFKGGLGSPLLPESLANKEDEFLVDTILNGRAGTAMPAWQPFLTHSEALWLVKQLKTTP